MIPLDDDMTRPQLQTLAILALCVLAFGVVLILAPRPADSQLAKVAAPKPLSHADLPEGFAERIVATGIDGATGMAIARDGRVFICEQTGSLRVVEGGKLLDEPFVKLEVDSYWERGLIGVALDPDFPTTPFVYLCHVVAEPYTHHRISRFTADGNRAVRGSEKILIEGDDQRTLGGSVPAGHQGGGIHFGPDGMLYVGLGEQTAGRPAQSLETFQGKILRIRPDGSIPEDNPFFQQAHGKYRAIWARGLRNPFAFGFQPETGRMYINDVGGQRFEEINEGKPGANYGWPIVEGPAVDERFEPPVHAYSEAAMQSISGGVFYAAGEDRGFPDEYHGRYFFCDYIFGWIRSIDPADPWRSEPFASGFLGPVDLRAGPDGSLWVLDRNVWVKDDKFRSGTGVLRRIFWVERSGIPAPKVAPVERERVTVPGEAITLRVDATGAEPLAYRWERNGEEIPNVSGPELKIEPSRARDDVARYRAVVSNSYGTAKSGAVRVRVATLRKNALSGKEERLSAEVEYDCYDTPPGRLAAPSRSEPLESGKGRAIALPPCAREKKAVVFRGLLQIARDGAYRFRAESSGPVILRVGGVDVVRGVGGSSEARDVIGLSRGPWPFELSFAHSNGTPRLELFITGSDGVEQSVAAESFAGRPALRGERGSREAPDPSSRMIPETVAVPLDLGSLPRLLSETGLFASIEDLEPAPGVVPYEVNVPAWNDGAVARRFIALPAGTTIGYESDAPWRFPAGTVFVQHLETGGAPKPRRLETRILVVDRDGGAFGATYKWKKSGDDAVLLTSPVVEEISPAAEENSRAGALETRIYPGPGDCALCHTPQAGLALGVRAAQIAQPVASAQDRSSESQLTLWSRLGFFDRELGASDLAAVPPLAMPSDGNAPLELRARSYLDANCSHCHRPGGVRAAFDARITTPLPKQNLVGVRPIAADLGVRDARIVTPGTPERSMVWLRLSRRGDVFAMPPVGSTRVDPDGVELIGSWIRSLTIQTR